MLDQKSKRTGTISSQKQQRKKCQTKTKRTRGMAGQNQEGRKNGRLKARQEER